MNRTDRDPFDDAQRADRPLHRAAWAGDTAEVERLLDGGADVNDRFSLFAEHGVFNSGLTPLIECAGSPRSDVATMRLLIERGADLTAETEAGVDALYYAAASTDVERVRLLIDSGLDPARVQGRGSTPLHPACGCYIYPHGSRSSAAVATLLLAHGCAVDAVDCVGRSALHYAAEGGDAACVALLLDGGAMLDGVEFLGKTPLCLASTAEVARRLIEAGADPRTRRVPVSPRMNARRRESVVVDPPTAIVERGDGIVALLDAGLDLDHRSERGQSLVELAAKNGNGTALCALVEAGAVGLDDSLVHAAASQSRTEGDVFRVLREAGLSLDQPDRHGALPIERAIRARNLDAVRELVALGVKWGAQHEELVRRKVADASTPRRSPPGLFDSYRSKLGDDGWASLQRTVELVGDAASERRDEVAREIVEYEASTRSLLEWERETFVRIVAALLEGLPPERGLECVDRQALAEIRAIAEVMGVTLD